MFLAFKILKEERPRVLISTGAGVAVPFIIVAKIKKIKTVYIESLGRINELSLSGRLVYKLVDKIFVQWPGLAEKYKKCEYYGQVL